MKKLFGVTIIIVGTLFILRILLGQDPEKRNRDYFPDMAKSFAYKSQTPNPFFHNGQTQQKTVTGTIPRDMMPLHYGASATEAVRAGDELFNPFGPENQADLARGQLVYQTFCQLCHGPGGKGDGPVVNRGYPPPPSLLLDRVRNMKDGQIYHTITFGLNNMPPYATQIERVDRWQAIAYVRKLQESQP